MKIGQRIYVAFYGDLVRDDLRRGGFIHVRDDSGEVHELRGNSQWHGSEVWTEAMPPGWPPIQGDLWGHLDDRFSVEYANGVKYFSSGGESTPVNDLVKERPGIRLIQRDVTEDL